MTLTLGGVLLFAGANSALAIVLGLPADHWDGNRIPFGTDAGEQPSDRYQQVYASSEFGGPIVIKEIRFFSIETPGGNLSSGTYELSLSTSPKAVNGLNLSDFDDNIGADNQLFVVSVLTGSPTPSVLSLEGDPFLYQPALGNLLLDIRVSGISHTGTYGYFDHRKGTSGGVFSRAHNFASGFENFGLVTEFVAASESVPSLHPLGMLLLAGLIGLTGYRRNRSRD